MDEVGSYLHPLWKMSIVKCLRNIFPRVQFLATTHNPLCLRGLTGNEVVVLRKNAKNHIQKLTDLPPIQALSVDQILTSELFGLGSTLDPDTNEMFEKYYL